MTPQKLMRPNVDQDVQAHDSKSASTPINYLISFETSRVWHEVRTEIERLHSLGYAIVPLGGGSDGRKPLIKFRGLRGPIPLHVVLRRMEEECSTNYAIDLRGLVVVDVDTDTPEAHELVLRRFGPTPFQIRTRKGTHYWYRNDGPKPKVAPGNQIRAIGLAIDVKSGAGELIAGPMAVRKDGARYMPASVQIGKIENLPVFVDREPYEAVTVLRSQPAAMPKVGSGSRNRVLTQKAVDYCSTADSEQELFEELCALRNIECDDPETMPDREVREISRWAWGLRLDGRLNPRGKSAVKVSYDFTAELCKVPNDGPNALMMYHIFQHSHAASRQWFMADAVAMSKAKIFPFGRDSIRRGLNLLVQMDVLRRREELCRLENGAPFLKYWYQLTGKGEGFKSYIMTDIQSRGFSLIEGGANS